MMPRFASVVPEAHVRCGSPREVVEAIGYARRNGLEVAVRGGGHDFAGRSTTDGVVIDVTPLGGISLSGGIATIGAGARLAAVYDALDPCTIPAGCGPTVGIAGLALGGGLGILGRAHGFLCDSLVRAQVVLADGSVVEAGEDSEPDLFWLLRGGGAPGVVTRLQFRVVEAPEITSFELHRPLEEAAELIARWQELELPDGAAVSLIVDPAGAHILGTSSEPVDLPWAVSAHTGRFRETKRLLAERTPPDEDTYSRSQFYARPLPVETIEALTRDIAGELDFTPLGGAYNRPEADATAFPHRDARFLLKHTSSQPDGWLDESFALVRPHGTGGVYPNFPEPGLGEDDYYLANADRVRRVRERYDPDGVFQPLPYGST
jgi:FAD/FMN-containing dehydrogenase